MICVVGGHSRNIGKTTVAASLIAATPEARWTAIKLTQHGHAFCTHGAGSGCACSAHSGPFEVSLQNEPNETDSGRFLSAGSERAYWVRCPQGRLAEAMPALRDLIAQSPNTIIESNSILQFLRPDLYLVVVDFSNLDMKDSTRLFLDRADAFIQTGPGTPQWPGVSPRWFQSKPILAPGSPELIKLLRTRLTAETTPPPATSS
jgi:hypothetical protein